jgi:hypothetical protein
MRDRLAVGDDVRDQILAEIVAGIGIGRVALEFFDQEFGVEHIYAHAAKRSLGFAGHGRRIAWLFEKLDDAVVLIHMHDAKTLGLLQRRLQTTNRHVGAGLDMLLEHFLVVHLVDVVAREDDYILRAVTLNNVDVLIDGVRRAEIPHGLGDALRGGQHVEALIAFGAKEVPAALHVADEAVRLVLRRDGDTANA